MSSSLHWPSAILSPQTLFQHKKFGKVHDVLRPQLQLLLYGTGTLVQFAQGIVLSLSQEIRFHFFKYDTVGFFNQRVQPCILLSTSQEFRVHRIHDLL